MYLCSLQFYFIQLIPEAADRETIPLIEFYTDCKTNVIVHEEVPGAASIALRRTPTATVATKIEEITKSGSTAGRESRKAAFVCSI